LCTFFRSWVQVSTAFSTVVDNQKRPAIFAPFKMQKKNPSGKMQNRDVRVLLQKSENFKK